MLRRRISAAAEEEAECADGSEEGGGGFRDGEGEGAGAADDAVGDVIAGDFEGELIDALVGEAPVEVFVSAGREIEGQGEVVGVEEGDGIEIDVVGPEEEVTGASDADEFERHVSVPVGWGEFLEAESDEGGAIV